MLFTILIFILGLFIGSFINVLVNRLPRGEGVILGRSYCDHCKKILSPAELIPVLSFILLKRRCRKCHKRISWQYPLVEIFTGLIFVYQYSINNYGLTHLIYVLIIFSSLWVIFLTDLKYRIIPDEILLILGLATFIYKLVFLSSSLPNSILSSVIFGGFFFTLFLFTRARGMGLGDVKFAFWIGLFLGFPDIIIAFYLSFLTGAVISLILILSGRKKFGQTVAFGPFLVIAVIITYHYSLPLWKIITRFTGLF